MLEAAYDDAAGVTAEFNLNLLRRINDELGGDFDLQLWQHKAVYNELRGRIEMHLVSLADQQVRVKNNTFSFARGETIHTENSYKYSIDEFIELAGKAGFQSEQVWVDENALFSVHLFRVADTQSSE